MMLKISMGIVIGTAAFGLLFYWLKKRKVKVGKAQLVPQEPTNLKQNEESVMANYGVQVANKTGQMVNLTDRPVMVADVIHIPYGANGSRQFHTPIKGVSVDSDYELDPASDGKFISVSYSGHTVHWEWNEAKALKPTNAKVIIFS